VIHVLLCNPASFNHLNNVRKNKNQNIENIRKICIPIRFTLLVPSVYMDVDSITGPLRLIMLTMRGDIPRSFRIKVTQIKKGSPLEAPKNCLQYHRGIRGSIESFNYQMPKHSNLPATPSYMVGHNLHARKGHWHWNRIIQGLFNSLKR